MTKSLTPIRLINYMKDFDYELTEEQAREILELLGDEYGVFTSTEIEMVTDYIVNGDGSIFANYFN